MTRLVDLGLEIPVGPSFTRIGHDVRRRVEAWATPPRLDDQVVLLTGGTSGIGRSAAASLAELGAQVIVTGRSGDRAEAVAGEINEQSGGDAAVRGIGADMGEPDDVRELAERILDEYERLDVLIHNAGALSGDRHTNSLGQEATIASQVYGPFLLTSLLLDRLAARSPGPARVLTMSSGGMYAQALTTHLELPPARYDGTRQYAIAKRAQVALNEMWADRVNRESVVFHAMHPGWAATPGVSDALPTFDRVMGPLLRTPAQGADTLVWLAGADEVAASSGAFWHDRRRRSTHKSPFTSRADTGERRHRLWDVVAEGSGADVPA